MYHSRPCAILIDCKVMQAPTGQRFRVVRVQRPGFSKNANRWDDSGPSGAIPQRPVPKPPTLISLPINCSGACIDGRAPA